MKTGMAKVPLHGGYCPPWLFEKMKQLGAVIIEAIIYEYGTTEVLRRLSNPIWFQSLGSVVGFDWHSSGLTTVLCGALKEGLHDRQRELGIFFCGGKGKTSRKTPAEIYSAGSKYGLSNDLSALERTSRLVAKVDSVAVQDGYQLYHHFIAFDRAGHWTVVQQGMNETERFARRYHWLSEGLTSYVDDPHKGVCGKPETMVLNLAAGDNLATRMASVELCYENPEKVLSVLKKINNTPKTVEYLSLFQTAEENPVVQSTIIMPSSHPIPSPNYLDKVLHKIYEKPPENYEKLLEQPGVGASTLRALAMVAEVTHGTKPSFNDPVRYAFAHGGKDAYPFPVQRNDIEHSLKVMRTAIEKAKLGEKDKMDALKKLALQENNYLVNNKTLLK